MTLAAFPSKRLFRALALLAITLRVIVPAGYMPASIHDGFYLRWCPDGVSSRFVAAFFATPAPAAEAAHGAGRAASSSESTPLPHARVVHAGAADGATASWSAGHAAHAAHARHAAAPAGPVSMPAAAIPAASVPVADHHDHHDAGGNSYAQCDLSGFSIDTLAGAVAYTDPPAVEPPTETPPATRHRGHRARLAYRSRAPPASLLA